MENPMGYHFAEAGDYTVYSWDPSSESLTSVLTVTAPETPSTLKLDDLWGYSGSASKFSLPSQIYCFAKSSENVSSFTIDSNGIYQNVYNRVGTFEMNILQTKYSFTSSLNPPKTTGYTYGPASYWNTYSTDKMIDYIGQSDSGEPMIVW
jgi:hypothetical protein